MAPGLLQCLLTMVLPAGASPWARCRLHALADAAAGGSLQHLHLLLCAEDPDDDFERSGSRLPCASSSARSQRRLDVMRCCGGKLLSPAGRRECNECVNIVVQGAATGTEYTAYCGVVVISIPELTFQLRKVSEQHVEWL